MPERKRARSMRATNVPCVGNGQRVVCWCRGCVEINPTGVVRFSRDVVIAHLQERGSAYEPSYRLIPFGSTQKPMPPVPDVADDGANGGAVGGGVDPVVQDGPHDNDGQDDMHDDVGPLSESNEGFAGSYLPDVAEDEEVLADYAGLYTDEELEDRQLGKDGSVEEKKTYKASELPEEHLDRLQKIFLIIFANKAFSAKMTEENVAFLIESVLNAAEHPPEFVEALPKDWRHLRATFQKYFHCPFPKIFKCDACAECGFLFRCESKFLEVCPMKKAGPHGHHCSGKRYKDFSEGSNKVSRKSAYFLDIKDLLTLLFSDKAAAELVLYSSRRETEAGVTSDIMDSKLWEKLRLEQPAFMGRTRNLLLGLSSDGTVIQEAARSDGVVDGPSPGSVGVMSALEVVVDQLLYLYRHGVEVYDAYHQDTVVVRAMLVKVIGDLRALQKLLGMKATPAKDGCFSCFGQGLPRGRGKTTYCHAAEYLPRPGDPKWQEKHSNLRTRCAAVNNIGARQRLNPEARSESCTSPRRTNGTCRPPIELLRDSRGLLLKLYQENKDSGISYSFVWKLPSYNHSLMVNYDPMHTIAGCVKDFCAVLGGTKVTDENMQTEAAEGRWTNGERPFEATSEAIELAEKWLAHVIECAPSAYANMRMGKPFTGGGRRCHDWCVLASPIGKGAVHLLDLPHDDQGSTATMYLDALSLLQRKWFTNEHKQYVQDLVVEALAFLEADFPFVLQDMKNHNLLHMAEGLTEGGPPWASAMWSFERFNKLITDWANKNMQYPCGSIIKMAQQYYVATNAALSFKAQQAGQPPSMLLDLLSCEREYDCTILPSYLSHVPGVGVRTGFGSTVRAQRCTVFLPKRGYVLSEAEEVQTLFQIHLYLCCKTAFYLDAWEEYIVAGVIPLIQDYHVRQWSIRKRKLEKREDVWKALKGWHDWAKEHTNCLVTRAIALYWQAVYMKGYKEISINNVKICRKWGASPEAKDWAGAAVFTWSETAGQPRFGIARQLLKAQIPEVPFVLNDYGQLQKTSVDLVDARWFHPNGDAQPMTEGMEGLNDGVLEVPSLRSGRTGPCWEDDAVHGSLCPIEQLCAEPIIIAKHPRNLERVVVLHRDAQFWEYAQQCSGPDFYGAAEVAEDQHM